MPIFDFYEVGPTHQKYFHDEGVELDSWTEARHYADELGDEWQCSVRVCERGREETEVIGPERALRAKIHNDNKKRVRNLMRAEREAMKRKKKEIKHDRRKKPQHRGERGTTQGVSRQNKCDTVRYGG